MVRPHLTAGVLCVLLAGVAAERPTPPRIVSLTPTITETLFALGSGEGVVGVTRFCNYPPEARSRTTVGGLIDVNVEAIVALRPDLVVAEPQQRVVAKLRELGLEVLTVENQTLDQLLSSFRAIGARVGREAEAAELITRIRERTTAMAKAVGRKPRPPVLVVVGRNPLVAAGGNTFIDELITAAGGSNILGDSDRPYPIVSMERVLLRPPEVIVECSGSMAKKDLTTEVREAWARWPTLPAVGSGRVYVSQSDVLLRPGPRLLEALDELLAFFHPQVAEKLGRTATGK